jgi:S1-C subfamily serine protease
MVLLVVVASGPAQSAERDAIVFIRVSKGADVVAQGTGFLISRSGFALTARHVVDAAISSNAAIGVSLKSKGAYPVRADVFDCGSQGVPDVCVIKINEDDVARERIDRFTDLACREARRQEKISAMGYPAGEANTLFEVSGEVVGGMGPQFLIPAVLPVASGMSGGPVYDNARYVIGVLKSVAQGTPHAYFTPVSQVSSRLAAGSVPCPTNPPPR